MLSLSQENLTFETKQERFLLTNLTKEQKNRKEIIIKTDVGS